MKVLKIKEDLMEKGLVGEGGCPAELDDGTITSPSSSAAFNEVSDDQKELDKSWKLSVLVERWREGREKAAWRKGQETDTIVRHLDSYPEGYPRLAGIIESDERFLQFRRFGILQTRLILYKQDELRRLEIELDEMDRSVSETDKGLLQSRMREDQFSGERKILMHEINQKYKEYGELLMLSRDIANLEAPLLRNYLDIKAYFDICKPLCLPETYIRHQGDVITLMPNRDKTWFDDLIERMFDNCQSRFTRYLLSTKSLERKADPENGIVLYSRRRFDAVVTLIVLALIAVLLIIPVYLVWQLTRGSTSISTIIAVLLVFTLVFCVALLKFTRAKRHEVLAGAAAYCAVLVTFIGNFGQLSASGRSAMLPQNMTTALISG